jgi:GntR family transcriptional repressor for pyruvate dehydrogenase complex
LQSVRALLRVWVDRVLRDPDEAKIALEQHTGVLAAIRDGTAEAAGNAMDSHMVTAGERLLRVIRN